MTPNDPTWDLPPPATGVRLTPEKNRPSLAWTSSSFMLGPLSGGSLHRAVEHPGDPSLLRGLRLGRHGIGMLKVLSIITYRAQELALSL